MGCRAVAGAVNRECNCRDSGTIHGREANRHRNAPPTGQLNGTTTEGSLRVTSATVRRVLPLGRRIGSGRFATRLPRSCEGRATLPLPVGRRGAPHASLTRVGLPRHGSPPSSGGRSRAPCVRASTEPPRLRARPRMGCLWQAAGPTSGGEPETDDWRLLLRSCVCAP